MKRNLLCLFVGVLTLSLGCTELMKRVAVKELDFDLHKVSLVSYDLSTMKLKVDLKAYNPNDIDAVIDRLDYSFSINEKNAANGSTARKETVKAGKERILTTTLSVNYIDLGVAILDAVKNQDADFKLSGTVYVDTPIGSISFPIDLLYP
jgi:LEA14-like dessication related protein